MKKKLARNHDSRKLKAAGIKLSTPKNGKYELEQTPTRVPGKEKKLKGKAKALALSEPVMLQAAKDRALGMSVKDVADKYSTTEGYINDALKKLYVNSKLGREILKGIILDNAISSGMRVRETIKDLQPMQAVIATGVMTQRFIDLEKHTQAAPPEVDFSELTEMSKMLKQFDGFAGIEDSTEGSFIDVDSEATDD